MNQMSVDMDPLSTYEYPPYDYAPTISTMPPYNYEIKLEQPVINQELINQMFNNVQEPTDKILTNINDTSSRVNDTIKSNVVSSTNNGNNDIKPDLKKKIKKEKGRRSNYWSEKITDENFKFYGCAVCNINYSTLQELDQHVAVHKDRVTSYDLKIKNLKKRKKMKKEQKRQKKISKIKKEDILLDIEIKPEDGYIGSEKASEYNNCFNNENKPVNNEKDVKPDMGNDNGNTGNDKQTKLNLEKIFKCFACQKQFPLCYYLKLHVRSHTGEKPYTCSVCGQSFITASKLGRHNKRIHLAVRYQCRICYRFFSKFENLTIHFDKKHPEDKLEGEPYDYNAILPYLKELEEELKEKAQKEEKSKTDEWVHLWGSSEKPDELKSALVPENEIKYPTIETNITIEEVKVDPPDLEIKEEPEEPRDDPYKTDFDFQKLDDDNLKSDDDGLKSFDDGLKSEDDVKDDSVNNDRLSDDEYFPSNTWAIPPEVDEPPPSPESKKRKGKSSLKCNICKKTLSTSSYLRVHMRTHTGEKPFRCYICGRGFITESKMHRHVLTHEETWEGGDAQIKIENIEPETNGQKNTNSKALIKKAKAKFNKKSKSSDGTKKYKTRPHSCEYCGKKFLHLETLQVHKKSHEGEELVLKCSYCLEVVVDEAALKDHEAKHQGPKPYLCTICGKTYKKKETMVYHRKHHKPDKDFICNVCSKSFNAACKLQRHLVSHGADKFVLRYECPVCAHMFHTKYHIQMHLSTHQKEGLIVEENRNEILAMVLQNARKIPKYSDATLNMTNVIPSDEPSRVCNICGKVFQHFYYLEEHLKSHGSMIAIEDITKVEEKKHVCPVCNKSFKLHYYLKLHSFTHSKEKPFICQQCGKGFITKGKLKRHLETHTGLKKYQCHICYKFFTRTSYLRIHVRTIHGNQDYNFRLDKSYQSLNSINTLPALQNL